MRRRPGTFCWAELATPDPEGARAFYQAVLGWRADPERALFAAPGAPGERPRATASLRPAPAGTAASWTSAVVVGHLPAARARAIRLGGVVLAEALPVTGLGTLAVIRDRAGICLGLFQPRNERAWAAISLDRPDPPSARPAARG
jgi:predicted enzyme related to lactoylglutathione lyase